MPDPWRRSLAIGAMAAVLAVGRVAAADAGFESLAMRVERNVTDKDHEVVIEVVSGDSGIASLQVQAPDGRTVVDLKFSALRLGIRRFAFESPEPKDLAALQSDYPAGDYAFSATTVAGGRLTGKAALQYRMPDPARLLVPGPDDRRVPVRGLVLQWTAGNDLAVQKVAIEDDRTGVKVIDATLSGGTRRLAVGDRVLVPATAYKLSIGTIAPNGNASYIEAAFKTAPK